jgi:glycosyltransferase involved in cell wall biosynthesis
MKVAYISSSGYADTDFSLINEMKKKVDLYYFLIITPYSLKYTAINIKKIYPISGIFKTNIYPEIEQFSDIFDIKKTYIINIANIFCINSIYMYIKLLLKLININIDIIHTPLYSAYNLLMLFLHKKIILTMHDPVPHSDNCSIKDFLYRKIAFIFIKYYIIFNKNQKNEFILKYKLKHKNIYISRLGIINYLQRYINIKNKIDNEKEYILFFGRIKSYKGLDYLFPAIKNVNETHKIKLIIAGYCKKYYFDISEYENYSYIEIINKYIVDYELAVLIQKALFVVCPYTDATQSGVVMSSFAFNIPVLATNVGGLTEYIEHGKSGYIIPAKNVNALVNGIKYLFDNRDILNEQKKYIKEKYHSGYYSWDKITDGIIEFYKTAFD